MLYRRKGTEFCRIYNIISNARSRHQQKAPTGKQIPVSEQEKVKDEASLSPSTASSKYTASITKGIKKSPTRREKCKKPSRKVVGLNE